MPSVQVRELPLHDLSPVVALCVRAMHDNPLHQRVFPGSVTRRRRCLMHVFTPFIRHVARGGHLYGAYQGGHLVGAFGMLAPGRCRPNPLELLQLSSAWRASGSPAEAMRIGRWLWAWARHDPTTPHWHLGPLVVQPSCQGRGLGQHLIKRVAEQIKPAETRAWLETDKPGNVCLYRRYGFEVAHTACILGTTCWFMHGRLAGRRQG